MKITHVLENQISNSVDSASFMLNNCNGSYSWIDAKKVKSRYQGIFFLEKNRLFRVIESIESFEPEEIVNNFFQVETLSPEKQDVFFMPEKKKSFVFETNHAVKIFLDFKEQYKEDYAEYEIKKEKDRICIKINYGGETYYLIIMHYGECNINKQKIEREYEYDKARNSRPYDRHVDLIGEINSQKIVFSFSSSKKAALEEAKFVFLNTEKLKEEKIKSLESKIKKISLAPEIEFAYNSCKIMLDGLCTKEGMFAGFPWFFQYWARDELISLKALNGVNKELAEKIINRWIKSINGLKMSSKINLDSRPEGSSSDSVGWLVKRTEEFPFLLREKEIRELFSFLDDNFYYSEKKESWMDSLDREGNRIEMQAMKLYLLKKAHEATKEIKHKINETILKKKVIQDFFNEGNLYDSPKDHTITPNIFIAYYFYPELLPKKVWEEVFQNALDKLWLSWGGVATIDKNNPNFIDKHDGEFGKSYHRGDSWFWINNLAALCLIDLNKERFKEYIEKIIKASTFEILYAGAIANHSEISSAQNFEPWGCVSQAFSAAMYIELIDKLIE
ncbi:MAG: amylo-alpha-1,6-glucosidase [Candidatus Nanoarchaeia archaeon]